MGQPPQIRVSLPDYVRWIPTWNPGEHPSKVVYEKSFFLTLLMHSPEKASCIIDPFTCSDFLHFDVLSTFLSRFFNISLHCVHVHLHSFSPFNYTAWLGRILPMVEYNPYNPIKSRMSPPICTNETAWIGSRYRHPGCNRHLATGSPGWRVDPNGRPPFLLLLDLFQLFKSDLFKASAFCPFLGGCFCVAAKPSKGWRILFKCNLFTYIITMIWDWNTMSIFSSSYYCNQIDNCPKMTRSAR